MDHEMTKAKVKWTPENLSDEEITNRMWIREHLYEWEEAIFNALLSRWYNVGSFNIKCNAPEDAPPEERGTMAGMKAFGSACSPEFALHVLVSVAVERGFARSHEIPDGLKGKLWRGR
jgi:hypothetical protein